MVGMCLLLAYQSRMSNRPSADVAKNTVITVCDQVVFLSIRQALEAAPMQTGAHNMIVETTNYYALPGKIEDVLSQRRHASAIRARLGLPAGRIFRKLEGPGPDLRWEC